MLPNAEIYGIANHYNMKQEVIDTIINATEHVNGKSVKLNNVNMTSSHPSILGMQQIKDQVLAVFDR